MGTRQSRAGAVARVLVAAMLAAGAAACTSEAVLYYGGPILTMDEKGRVVEALAVQGDHIAAVGSLEELGTWIEDYDPRRVDLGGRAMLPGFIDAHSHFPGSGLVALWVDVRPVPMGPIADIEGLVEALNRRAQESGSGDWVAGFGYDDTLLAERRHPTREDLDRVSPDKPVFVLHLSGHVGVANTRALEVAGITDETPDPDGGRIDRDVDGHATGLLEESASDIVRDIVLNLSIGDALTMMRAGQDDYLSHGVTTAQMGYADERQMRMLYWASRLGLLELRLVLWPTLETAGKLLDGEFSFETYDQEWLRVGAAKLIADGSLQAYTGYLTRPYEKAPARLGRDYRGWPRMDRAQLTEAITRLHRAGWQVAVHGNGDASIDDILAAFAAAQDAAPRADARPVLIHAQTARRDQVQRMAELGMIPSFFSLHTWYWGDRHREVFLGASRARRISPAADAVAAGVPFTIHCDTPVVPMEPLRLVWAAVNRRTQSGRVLGSEQRISVMDGLRAVTTNAAHQNFEEHLKGSLEPGKLADLVILDRSPLDDPATIDTIRVEQTIISGRTVYVSPDLTPRNPASPTPPETTLESALESAPAAE